MLYSIVKSERAKLHILDRSRKASRYKRARKGTSLRSKILTTSFSSSNVYFGADLTHVSFPSSSSPESYTFSSSTSETGPPASASFSKLVCNRRGPTGDLTGLEAEDPSSEPLEVGVYCGFDDEPESEDDAFPAADGGRWRLLMSVLAAVGEYGKFGSRQRSRQPIPLLPAIRTRVSSASDDL
jgi:hypothetical protein